MSYVAAGSFSASISAENKSLYLWGTGTFGEFHSPHRVKKIPYPVFQVSIGNMFGVAITDDRRIYSWGENSQGQLGIGSFQNLGTPKEMEKIFSEGRQISQVACGSNFVISLG